MLGTEFRRMRRARWWAIGRGEQRRSEFLHEEKSKGWVTRIIRMLTASGVQRVKPTEKGKHKDKPEYTSTHL